MSYCHVHPPPPPLLPLLRLYYYNHPRILPTQDPSPIKICRKCRQWRQDHAESRPSLIIFAVQHRNAPLQDTHHHDVSLSPPVVYHATKQHYQGCSFYNSIRHHRPGRSASIQDSPVRPMMPPSSHSAGSPQHHGSQQFHGTHQHSVGHQHLSSVPHQQPASSATSSHQRHSRCGHTRAIQA
jgi:hypothetical protein